MAALHHAPSLAPREQSRMKKLEALRLEVDSRRRTVAKLGRKVCLCVVCVRAVVVVEPACRWLHQGKVPPVVPRG
jgi:hypothetical protein